MLLIIVNTKKRFKREDDKNDPEYIEALKTRERQIDQYRQGIAEFITSYQNRDDAKAALDLRPDAISDHLRFVRDDVLPVLQEIKARILNSESQDSWENTEDPFGDRSTVSWWAKRKLEPLIEQLHGVMGRIPDEYGRREGIIALRSFLDELNTKFNQRFPIGNKY